METPVIRPWTHRGKARLLFPVCAGGEASASAPRTREPEPGVALEECRSEGRISQVVSSGMTPGFTSGAKRLFQIKIAQRLFGCRLLVGFLEGLFELSSQDIFFLVFGLPRFPEFILAAPRLIRQDPCRIRNIHIRCRFWRRRVRQNRG